MPSIIELKIVVEGKEGLATIELTDEQLKKLGLTGEHAANQSKSAWQDFKGTLTDINQGIELAKKALSVLMVPIEKAGQFEQYEASLKVMLGSAEAAKARIAELVEFAKTTPFELPQVVEAANQLQALGRYSEENLTMLGDLASASGKPMEQALGAFAKMASGQKGIAVDMFRDLLITTDDWQKATGKGISSNGELLASTEEMLAALPKILEEKNFSGMMEMQAQTFNGSVSNMQDAIGQLMTQWGTGLLPLAKDVVAGVTAVASAFIDQQSQLEQTTVSTEALSSRYDELSNQYLVLAGKTNKTAEETEIYKGIINALQTEFPNYLGNVDLLNGSYDKNATAIKGAKDQLNEYISAQVTAALMADENAAIIESTSKKMELARRKTALEGELKAATDSGKLNEKEKTPDMGGDIGSSAAAGGASLVAMTVGERLKANIKAMDDAIANYDSQIQSRKQNIDQINAEITKEFGLSSTIAPTTPSTEDPNKNKPTGYVPTEADKKDIPKVAEAKKVSSVIIDTEAQAREDNLRELRLSKVQRDLDLEENMHKQTNAEILEDAKSEAELEIQNSEMTTDQKIAGIERQLQVARLSTEEQKQLAEQLTQYQVQKWNEEKAERAAIVQEMQGRWMNFSQDILDTSVTGKERMNRIWQGMKLEFIQETGKMIIAHVAGEQVKTGATTSGAVARVAIVAWETAASIGKTMLSIAATVWESNLKFFSWAGPFAAPLAAVAVATELALVKASIKAVGFAEGGVVDRPTFAMIGEGTEPEIVTPLRTFQQVIQQDIIPKLQLHQMQTVVSQGTQIDYSRLAEAMQKVTLAPVIQVDSRKLSDANDEGSIKKNVMVV